MKKFVNDPEDVEIRYEMPRENITDAHRAVVKEIQQALVRLVKVGAKP